MKRDDLIFDIIEKEHQRQLKGIELIASENFVSDQVMQAMGSCLTNKYAEGYPGKRYYGGCEVVDQSERIAIDRLKEIFGAEWANVQPHSGAQANAAVFLAVLNPGDKFMGLNLAHGGHLSHGSLVNTSGIIYTPCEYNLNAETGRVDYDQMEEVALREKPKMIIGGGSAYSREWDYKRMREIADKVGAIFLVDMAHPAGLIAAGMLDNPVKYAHIVTSTTHKTLRGPRGGVIMMGKDFPNPWGKTTPKGEIKMMSQLLDSAVFPGIQGGPLEHVIAAKAVAFGEILQPEFKEYAAQVQKNAAVLAQALIDRGFTIVSGGTDNHSMLVDLRSKYPDLTGKVAEKALVSADITVNKNMVPFDSRSAFQTSGIRLGTPAITTRGAKEDLMLEIAEMIETVLSNVDNEDVIAAKAVAFGEILQPEFKEYAAQVQKNAAVLAQALIDRGFTIVSGGTDNHSMLVDLRSKYPDLTGKVAEKALVSADITVNKNMVPFDSRSAFQTSGIRLGTPAITTRGAKEDLMLEIAEMIETVLSNVDNEEVIAQVRARVNETMKAYPLFAY